MFSDGQPDARIPGNEKRLPAYSIDGLMNAVYRDIAAYACIPPLVLAPNDKSRPTVMKGRTLADREHDLADVPGRFHALLARFAASASGKVESITGAILRAANSGQTFLCSASATGGLEGTPAGGEAWTRYGSAACSSSGRG